MSRYVTALFRYPVKGLSPEPLDQVALTPGQGFPADRIFAVTNGEHRYDFAHPEPWPKTRFLMLMLHENLARLRSRYDDAAGRLTIQKDGVRIYSGVLADAGDRRRLADLLAQESGAALAGQPEVLNAPGLRFTDVCVTSPAYMNAVSLINLASVRELSRAVGRDLHPLRFRGNLYFDGGAAWEEHDWVGREIQLGPVRARVLKRTRRCPATQVDPNTAARDVDVPRELVRAFGHMDMGVYAEVLDGGELRRGVALTA